MFDDKVRSKPQTLDRVFLALGHPVRRQILVRLAQGPATVTDIAEPFDMSLNAVSKHLKVLEKASLIQRQVLGREHYCSINPQPLEEVSNWLTYYHAFRTSRLDALEQEILAKSRGCQTGSKTIQLRLSRLLPASREEVFDMWLDPDSLRRWMCPGDSVVACVELHPVIGGTFRIDTQVKDGRVFVHTGQYLEIQRPDRLVFTWNSTVLGDRSSQVTVEFYEQAENCLMVLLHELPPDDEIFEDHRRGWATILDLFVQHQKANVK